MQCIEFLGMSRAGKTTQKNFLYERLSNEGARVTSLGRPNISFSDFGSVAEFHWFMIEHFEEGIKSNQDSDFVILDRGFYDRQVLLDFDYANAVLSDSDYGSIKQLLSQRRGFVDRGFIFLVSPGESLKRWSAQRSEGLDYSHLNEGLDSGDNFKGLNWLYGSYSALSRERGLQVIDGLNSKEANFDKILEGLLINA